MRLFKSYIIGAGLIAVVAVLGFVFRYDIHDWIKLRGYTPDEAVVAIADRTTMLPNSRRLFYVNRPVIADKATFNDHCRKDEHSPILGCYLPGQRGIYLLDVSDPNLSGIKEVTGAHELLHAAYERLSSDERRRVDALLQVAYENTTDTRIIETVESYRRDDPSVVPNEIHSIFGTEVRNLSPELEEYYSRYFSDRLKIVELSENYIQTFINNRDKVRQYKIQIEKLEAEIKSIGDELSSRNQELKNMQAQMKELMARNQVDERNALVPEYNAKIDRYNALVDSVESKIAELKTLVQKHNETVDEGTELIKAIDSREIIPEN